MKQTESIIIRVSTELKSTLQSLADKDNKKLSDYIRLHLTQLANNESVIQIAIPGNQISENVIQIAPKQKSVIQNPKVAQSTGNIVIQKDNDPFDKFKRFANNCPKVKY